MINHVKKSDHKEPYKSTWVLIHSPPFIFTCPSRHREPTINNTTLLRSVLFLCPSIHPFYRPYPYPVIDPHSLTLLVPQQLRRATSTSTTLSLPSLTQLRCSPVARICSSNREWRRWRPPWSIPDATTCRRSVSSARPWSRYLPSSAVSSSLAAGAPSPRWSLRAPHNGQWSPRSWTGTDTWPVACWIFPIPATGPRPHLGRTCV